MVLTVTPRNNFDSCHTTLKTSLTSGTQTSGIVLNALQRNGVVVSWPATSGGILRFYRGGLEETIGYSSATVDGTTSDITLVGVTRSLPWNDGTSYTTDGTGLAFPAGTFVDLVLDARHMNGIAFQDLANTFTDNQTLATTKNLYLGNTGNYIKGVSGGDISFKDANTSLQTLSSLAAAAGTDHKFLNTAADTTASYLTTKLLAGAGITMTTGSPAGNETSTVAAVNTVATGHTGLSTVTSGGLLVGAGTSNMTIIGPGSANQVPLSNGSTIAMANPKYYEQVVFMSAVTSATQTNPTTDTAFDTHTYSISANDITATTGYIVEFGYSVTYGTSGQLVLGVGFGASAVGGLGFTSTGSNAGSCRFVLMGTAAAGASVPVRITGVGGLGAVTGAGTYAAGNVATNGTLTLDITARFGTSNGSNTVAVNMCKITKFSTSAF